MKNDGCNPFVRWFGKEYASRVRASGDRMLRPFIACKPEAARRAMRKLIGDVLALIEPVEEDSKRTVG